eukprot:2999101-Prymnesium_polylepis.1
MDLVGVQRPRCFIHGVCMLEGNLALAVCADGGEDGPGTGPVLSHLHKVLRLALDEHAVPIETALQEERITAREPSNPPTSKEARWPARRHNVWKDEGEEDVRERIERHLAWARATAKRRH